MCCDWNLIINSKLVCCVAYQIFSVGARQVMSSSTSSSLSSVAGWWPAAKLIVEPENMSGTGRMLGRRWYKSSIFNSLKTINTLF